MCIIAVNRLNGRKITEESFNKMWEVNRHGFGMMWLEDDHIQTFKSMVLPDCYKKYSEVFDNRVGDIVLHFRIATQGQGIDNVHPFKVVDDLWMVHNGIISQWSGSDMRTEFPNVSDTRLFVDHILKTTADVADAIHTEPYQMMLSKYITSDKLAFLDTGGVATIINVSNGEMFEGNWYSNGSYKRYTYTPSNVRTLYSTTACCGKKVNMYGKYFTMSYRAKTVKICIDCAPYLVIEDLFDFMDVDVDMYDPLDVTKPASKSVLALGGTHDKK